MANEESIISSTDGTLLMSITVFEFKKALLALNTRAIRCISSDLI
ncbi:hypothetical protein [Serratia fonticola]